MIESEKEYTCSKCGAKLKSIVNLANHHAKEHPKPPIYELILVKKSCEKCGKEIEAKRYLKRGIPQLETERRFCDFCSHGHSHTKEWNEKISVSLKERDIVPKAKIQFDIETLITRISTSKPFIVTCITCGKLFLSSSISGKCCSQKCIGGSHKGIKHKAGSKAGGLRNGGGKSKQIFHHSKIAGEMKLNTEEIKLATILDKLELKWERNWKGFPYITKDGKYRKYYPDFHLIENDWYLEYKGWITEEMIHKMEDAKKRNDLKLLIIYGNDRRYKDLGLSIVELEVDNALLSLT
jgi:hypothetical protein